MDTDFAPHNLVNNGGVLCRASASSTGGAQPFQAFDNSSVTGWISNTGDPTGWLQLWIAVPQKLKSYSITAGTQYWQYDNGNRLPKNFTMQGSADGVAWDVLDTRVNQTGWTEGQTRNFVCNSPTATRYNFFRVVITANNGDADYTQIGELNLYTDDLNPVQYLAGMFMQPLCRPRCLPIASNLQKAAEDARHHPDHNVSICPMTARDSKLASSS